MDVQEKIDELIAVIEKSRSMPMSSSCVINRADVLGRLGEIRETLPEEFAQAELLLRDRESVIEEGRREAERIVAEAHEERGRLLSESEMAKAAREQADEIRAQAAKEAGALREEADDYVDKKLANFEVVLERTMDAVRKGREQIHGRQVTDELGEHVDAVEAGKVPQQAGPFLE